MNQFLTIFLILVSFVGVYRVCGFLGGLGLDRVRGFKMMAVFSNLIFRPSWRLLAFDRFRLSKRSTNITICHLCGHMMSY